MAMGCHRIPFWPDQALRQLTNRLISFLIFSPLDHYFMFLYHNCVPCFLVLFAPSDNNITSPWVQQKSVLPSSIRYWRQKSSRFPNKYLSMAGSEVGCMLEYLSLTPTTSLSNLFSLAWCSNLSLVSRQSASMLTMYCSCVPSCSRNFYAESNTGGLVGIECDCCFDTIILRCDASSSVLKAFPFLYQFVIRSSQLKHITFILIFSFKSSILYILLFNFFSSLSTAAAVFQNAKE